MDLVLYHWREAMVIGGFGLAVFMYKNKFSRSAGIACIIAGIYLIYVKHGG